MAFSIGMAWEVRSTGSDSNGGGFLQNATGTDYSQQDSPQVSYTDLVIGSTNTQLTSAANPFTSAHVGNIINITSGSGFTVQRVQIISVSSGVATCDKACGTANSTGGVGVLGGGLATIAAAALLTTGVATHTIWIRNATYTLTAAVSLPSSVVIIGYGTTRGDNVRPIITTATNSISLFNSGSIGTLVLQNLRFTTTATTRGIGVDGSSGTSRIAVVNCSLDGFTTALYFSYAAALMVYSCQLLNATSAGVNYGAAGAGGLEVRGCYFNNCVTSLIVSGANPVAMVSHCVFGATSGTSGTGISLQGSSSCNTAITNCTFYSNAYAIATNINGQPGYAQMLVIRSCIFSNSTKTAISAPSGATLPGTVYATNNAFWSNAANKSTGFVTSSDVTLTSTPFTNASGGDFSLNSTSGGGAACKGTGYPQTYGSSTTATPDIGAVPATSSSGGGTGSGGNSAFIY